MIRRIPLCKGSIMKCTISAPCIITILFLHDETADKRNRTDSEVYKNYIRGSVFIQPNASKPIGPHFTDPKQMFGILLIII